MDELATTPIQPLMKPNEVIAYLQISARTYHRMVREGQLPVRWVRDGARFELSEVRAALPRGARKPLPSRDRAVRPVRGVTDLTTRLKRKAITWPRT